MIIFSMFCYDSISSLTIYIGGEQVATPSVGFQPSGEFWRDLNGAVKAYLTPAVKTAGYKRLHRKAVIIVASTMAMYVPLILADSAWEVAVFGVGFVLATEAAAFNIMHDGNHRSFSRSMRVNRIAGFTLEFLGGSSFTWDYKHNRAHHTYPNVDGLDDDIDQPPLARLASTQEWKPWHRWQHLYLWLMYGLVVVRWQLFGDLATLVRGRISQYELRNFNHAELRRFALGKVLFIGWAFALPIGLHHTWHGVAMVLATYMALSWLFGFIMVSTFQLAHCVDEAEFSSVGEADESGKLPNDWAVLQVLATSDFCPRNPFVTAFMGGLNYQLEHHLFSSVAHVHYPEISQIVRQTCLRHGLEYKCQATLRGAIAGHYRHLFHMGKRPGASQSTHA